MHVITIKGGRTFSAEAGETLLDAALRQRVVLNYSCRSGRCSSCKGRVCAGTTVPVHDELGLTAEERAAGWVLTCVREASSDVDLEIEDLRGVNLPEVKTLPCRIQSREHLSHDVMRVVLRLPPGSPLTYLPGQYVNVIGTSGQRRSYSIANAPRADKQIELHIREVANGTMSRYWFQQAKVNDLLHLHGPLGTFFLREQSGRDLIMLATGTGIAPVKAMLESLARLRLEARPQSVAVFWGGRKPEDLYWEPSALELPIQWVPVLSRADAAWVGARGYVQDVFMATKPDLSRVVAYACGSDAMIHSAELLLRAEGLPNRRFRSDTFLCTAAT